MPKATRTAQQKQFDLKLGQKLQNIRKKAGYNQEMFYEKCVRELNISACTSGSSAQKYMSKIENGTTSCPLQLLPVYARIAGCTIAELLDTTEFVTDSPAELAPETVCRFINKLHSEYNVEIIEITKSYEMGKTGYALFFDDDWHKLPTDSFKFMLDYLKGMHSLYKSELLDADQLKLLSENAIQKIAAKQKEEAVFK